MWSPTVRERLLTQHFLQRFLENDLVSPDADRHDAIAMVCGGLLALALFASILISLKFLFMPFPSPGRTADLAIYDRFFFIASAMIAMALVAVIAWDALSLDPRDTAILASLPIPQAVIVRAKLRAIAIFAGGFALTISALSSVFHPTLMVARLPIGVFPALALIAVHLVITIAAGLFAFATIVVVRELLRAALGVRFTRVSAPVQALLIVAVITSFLLLPAILARATQGGGEARLWPPVWFLGLHETLAGRLVMELPPPDLPRRIKPLEERAAARYRENAARLRPLAWRAVAAFMGSLLLAVGGYYWNSRQLPLPLVGGRASKYRAPGILSRATRWTIVRAPASQAGFFLTLHCLFRSAPHRVVLAGCTALSLAISILLLAAVSRAVARDAAAVPAWAFSTQTTALMIMLAGFRHIMRLPADIRGNRLFRLAWLGSMQAFLAGVRRAAVMSIVVPVIIVLLPANLYLLGEQRALMHTLSGLLLGIAFLSFMTCNATQLPFVASYAPAADLNTIGPAVLVGGLFAISIFARIEAFALTDPSAAAAFWGALVVGALVPRFTSDRGSRLDLPTAFDVPTPGATRLDLG